MALRRLTLPGEQAAVVAEREQQAPTRALSLSQRLRRLSWQPYLYLLPALTSIVIWIYWPLVSTIELSFYQWNLLPNIPRRAVGLDNYVRVLSLPELRNALLNTGLYIAGVLPFSVVLPLAVAILIADISGRWREVYRAIIFVPVLMAPVVVAVIWRWMLHPLQGILNQGLAAVSLPTLNVFGDASLALWGIVGITAWKLLGFSVLIFSAGLTGISRDYVEAAQVDGATRWQVVRHITLPLLSPTIAFMVLLSVLLSAQWTFPLIDVLTNGGPFESTTNVYFLMWEYAFRNFNVGFSSAAAVLMFAAFGSLAWLFTWLTDRYSFYDA